MSDAVKKALIRECEKLGRKIADQLAELETLQEAHADLEARCKALEDAKAEAAPKLEKKSSIFSDSE